MPTTTHSEPLNAGTSRQVYQAGDIDEMVTLIHTGDASGDLRVAVNTSGDLNENVAIIPRSTPVEFRLEARAVITAMSTGGDDRRVTVIATPIFELAWLRSMEEELFNIRCLLTQSLSEMIVAREMQMEQLAIARGPAEYQRYLDSRSRTGIPDSNQLLTDFASHVQAPTPTDPISVATAPPTTKYTSPLPSAPLVASTGPTVTSPPTAPLVPVLRGLDKAIGNLNRRRRGGC